ncbi:hypothetical protein M9458_001677, partial [Cirrhinus mrigala]
MRSIWGLIALVASATFYLYLLVSAFLPPGPRAVRVNDGEHTADEPEEEEL